MKFPISTIAQLIGATIEGNANAEIFTLSKIEEGKPGGICFLANPKYTHHIYSTQASAVIVANDFVATEPILATLLRVENPYNAFTFLLQKAQEMMQVKTGIEQPCFISPTAKIGENVYIGAFAYIGHYAEIGNGTKIYPHTYIGDNAKIGENTTLHANVSVYMGCEIGHNCLIHAGVVVGSDGFGHAPQNDGTYAKIPQIGNVVIENHVEIGANTTIDRGTMGSTRICDGVKLDNLIQVAHNVVIGKNTVIAAQTGISGSTKIGESCMIGGQVGFVGHINITNGVKIGAQSGVSKDIRIEKSAWRGSPVQEYRQQLKSEAIFRQLEELSKKVHELEKMMKG